MPVLVEGYGVVFSGFKSPVDIFYIECRLFPEGQGGRAGKVFYGQVVGVLLVDADVVDEEVHPVVVGLPAESELHGFSILVV